MRRLAPRFAPLTTFSLPLSNSTFIVDEKLRCDRRIIFRLSRKTGILNAAAKNQ
jgi:hypothetical protein